MQRIKEEAMYKTLNTKRFVTPQSDFSPGPAPFLEWIEIEKLVVDDTYQREIGRRGTMNVHQISENFDWSKFAPVIVAPVEGGQFAIVDGQHQTTAAILRSQKKVPCQVVQADRAKQAAAYAAVNGNITKTTAQQLYHAKVAAGDKDALRLAEVCAAAGVEIVRRSLVQSQIKVGQTQAVGALSRCLTLYGRDTLITSLQCITQTADGNAGFVRSTIVEALCEVLNEAPAWRDAGEILLRTMDKFKFGDVWDQIAAGRDQIFPSTAKKTMADTVRKFLKKRLGQSPGKEAA
jgi:ParB-like nuclease domain